MDIGAIVDTCSSQATKATAGFAQPGSKSLMHADPPSTGERYLKCQSGNDKRYHTCCEAQCNAGFVRDRIDQVAAYKSQKALYYCDAETLKMRPCIVDPILSVESSDSEFNTFEDSSVFKCL